MQIKKLSFTPDLLANRQIAFGTNQENASAPQEKNNTTKNVIIATAVATPVVILGLYKALKRGKANEIIETTTGIKELPKPNIEKIINETREKLTRKPTFSPEALDERITNGATKPDAWSFDDMAKYYEELEQQVQAEIRQAEENARRIAEKTKREGQELVASLDKLGKGTSVVDEKTVNNVLETQGARKSNAWDPADMKRYYENDCITESYENGIKKITYPRTLDGKQTIKTIYSDCEVETTTFKNITDEIVRNKDGKIIQKSHTERLRYGNKSVAEEFNPDNGSIIKRIVKNGGNTSVTGYHGDIKVTTYMSEDSGKLVTKTYQRENGKYKCIYRETTFPLYDSSYRKTVEQLENGYSKTTITDSKETKVIFRDKKGKILSEEFFSKPDGPDGPAGGKAVPPTKMLAAWYKDYLALCGKYGEPVRICGVKGGAWDHYYELCLRRDNPEAYAAYLRNQEYRARYDESARICVAVRNGYIKPGVYEDMTPFEKELYEEFKELLKQLPEHERKRFLEEFNNSGIQSLEDLILDVRTKIHELANARSREHQQQGIMIYA